MKLNLNQNPEFRYSEQSEESNKTGFLALLRFIPNGYNTSKLIIIKTFLLISAIIIVFQYQAFSELEITYPTSDDIITVNEEIRIEWFNSTAEPVDLFYSTDNGVTWNTLASGINENYYDWKVPYIFPLNLILKIESNYFTQPYLIWEKVNAHGAEIRSCTFSPDSKYLVTCSRDNLLKIWDIEKRLAVDSLYVPEAHLYNAYYFHNNDSVLIAFDSSIAIWDRKNRLFKVYLKTKENNYIRDCSGHPTEPVVAIGSLDTCRIYSISEDRQTNRYLAQDTSDHIYSTRFSKDGNYFIYCTYNGNINLIDYKNQSQIVKYSGHGSVGQNTVVWSGDISPNNEYIISGGVDKTARLWKIGTDTALFISQKHTSHIRTVRFHPSGKYFLSSGLDGVLWQWSVINHSIICDSINHQNQILWSEYSSSGDSIVTTGRGDNAIRLWKNFGTGRDSAFSICRPKYPSMVRIPDVKGTVGERVNIPIAFEAGVILPETFPFPTKVNLKIVVPSRLLEIEGNVKHSYINYPNDTISYTADFSFENGTFSILSARALFSEIPKDLIKIIDFQIEGDTSFVVNKVDGIVSINSQCELDKNKNLMLSVNPNFIIYPNPSENLINISLNLPEDGVHKIELYDSKGEKIKTYADADYKSGKYDFIFDVSKLSSGNYYLVLVTPHERYSQILVIIH